MLLSAGHRSYFEMIALRQFLHKQKLDLISTILRSCLPVLPNWCRSQFWPLVITNIFFPGVPHISPVLYYTKISSNIPLWKTLWLRARHKSLRVQQISDNWEKHLKLRLVGVSSRSSQRDDCLCDSCMCYSYTRNIQLGKNGTKFGLILARMINDVTLA